LAWMNKKKKIMVYKSNWRYSIIIFVSLLITKQFVRQVQSRKC